MSSSAAPNISSPSDAPQAPVANTQESAEKSRKRDFFKFGKKEDDKRKTRSSVESGVVDTGVGSSGLRSGSPLAPSSPSKSPYALPASPRHIRSASPRTHSPASSMIFERNVQEEVTAPQPSPAIPSHMITEHHIPPALDATTEAITDRRLNPDKVEIVTHTVHQPAASVIADSLEQPHSPLHTEDSHVGHTSSSLLRHDSDNVSNYASLDAVDVRRLSFISFADVVQAEHDLGDQRRDSTQLMGHSHNIPRSPSPLRSPVSSNLAGTSPPTSLSPSMHETSPHRSTLGELNIETMRQALRKTGSADLSTFKAVSGAASSTPDHFSSTSHLR